MNVIGFNFTKNDFRYCVLSDSEKPPKIIDKNKIVYPIKMETSELMEWFEDQLSLIIDKHKPQKLSHKISTNITKLDQIKQSCYPQAILNLVANKKKISINCYSSQGINATKFGQPKKIDVFSYIDEIIKPQPPYWDKATKEALLVAWFNIL
jgi:hypothetical protein